MKYVIKIGGKMAEDDALIRPLAGEMKSLDEKGGRVLLVHGGGVTISALQERFGIQPRFADGLRQTDPEEMELVDMALAGAVNKRLVRILWSEGISGWGFCGADGAVLTACGIGPESDPGNRTGRPDKMDTRPVEMLWNSGYLPVFAPPSVSREGLAMNVNADQAALALAAALRAHALLFLSDVPGVLDQGKTLTRLTPRLIEEKIARGVIAGGMIPKTRSAADALHTGVGSVIIGSYSGSGDLAAMLNGRRGTRIEKE